MSPHPGVPHQRASSRLWALLDATTSTAVPLRAHARHYAKKHR